MMIDHLGKTFYIDKRLYQDIKVYTHDVVKSNLDLVIIFSGAEGNGKSVLSRQIAWVISYILKNDYDIDKTPTIDDLHFNLNEYIKRSIHCGKHQINILDESRSVLNRKSSMTRESKRFTNYLSECRKFNQFHLLCLPSFTDLDKYVFLHRSRYFINVGRSRDKDYKIVRGFYFVYPKNSALISCYESGLYQVPRFNPKSGAFKGSFGNIEAFDNMNKYEAKQKDIMTEKYLEKTSEEKKKELREFYDLKQMVGADKAGEIKGVSGRTVYNKCEEYLKLKEEEQ